MTARSEFSQALAAQPVSRGGTGCKVRAILEQLDKASRTEAERALVRGNGVTTPRIVAAFKAMEHTITKWPIDAHRRGECACSRG